MERIDTKKAHIKKKKIKRKGRDLLRILLFFGLVGYFMVQNAILYGQEQEAKGGSDSLLKVWQDRQMTWLEKDRRLKGILSAWEKDYNDALYHRQAMVEVYGNLQRMAGKDLVDDPQSDRRVYRGKDDYLFYIIPRKVEVAYKADNLLAFANLLAKDGIGFTMISAPSRNEVEQERFPRGAVDYCAINRQAFLQELRSRQIRTLDLQEELASVRQDRSAPGAFFYRTDTHWVNEVALEATRVIRRYLSEQGFALGEDTAGGRQYQAVVYPHVYLGSMGRRTGKDYAGSPDDYTLLLPRQQTALSYTKSDNQGILSGERRGSFEEVFVHHEVLTADDIYADRYTAMMGYGTPLEHIHNDNIAEEGRLVLIKDSFAMPVAAYLSEYVRDIYLVDLRNNDLAERLPELIRQISPHQVVYLFSPTCLYYYEEMFYPLK